MITLIIGTNRRGSTTKVVAREIQGLYAKLKAPFEMIDLADLPPALFSPDAYEEKPRGFDTFTEKVLRSDGLVVMTPEYNGSMPGVLKYFIDMLPFPENFDSRPVCFIGLSSGAWGALRAVEHLQQIFGYRDAYIYPKRVFLPSAFNLLDKEGRLKNSEILGRLERQAAGFIEFVRYLKQ